MIGQVGASRPVYYDRNPSTKGRQYSSGGLAPHADVSRWSYTVPTGKIFYVQSAIAKIRRITAAAPAAIASCYVQATTSDANAPLVLYCAHLGNAVNDGETQVFGGTGILKAGDIIGGVTGDGSTGGTQMYSTGMFGVEADA